MHNEEQGAGCRSVVMCVASIGLGIGSIYLWTTASDDLRKSELHTYSDYVNSWQQANRSHFVHSKFVLWSPEGVAELVPDEDVLHSRVKDEGEDVPSFDPFEYRLVGKKPGGTSLIPPANFADQKQTTLYINATGWLPA